MSQPAAPTPSSEVPVTRPPQPIPKTWLPFNAAIWFWGHARKVVVLVLGVTILLLGVAMLVLPGPGWVTIFAGLALLATEFAWARWTLKQARDRFEMLKDAAVYTWNNTPTTPPPPEKPGDKR
jgi:hypothetical protein